MINGILNILKPPGMTSHDVVSFVRRTYGQKRVGHAGTLDPAAAGVLPVFLGTATRLIEYQADADKSYRVELTFGFSTDTGDDTGKVIERAVSFVMPDQTVIWDCFRSFTGNIQQVPPMYSALKMNGKKLYELARAGITVEREARTVTIFELDLVHIGSRTILFDVACSKGTYIRTLCQDIGQKLRVPAVMSFLVRTRVGVFHLADAYSLEEIAVGREALLLPPERAVSHLPAVTLSPSDSAAYRNGRTVWQRDTRALLAEGTYRVYDSANTFIGIADCQDNKILPAKVFHPGQS